MDKKENIETAETAERKSGRNWTELKVIFLVLPIVLTMLFPLGGLHYLFGRFVPSSIGYACMLYPIAGVFIIYCFFASIVRLFSGWRKHTGQKILLIIAEIAVPLLFVALYIMPFFVPNDSEMCWRFYKPFTYGFRDRMKSKADIEAIRDWLGTFSEEDCTGYNGPSLYSDEWPKSVKMLNPRRIYLFVDDNGNPKVRMDHAGGGFIGSTGVEIGMDDMEIPLSDFSNYGEYRLPVESGVYVWHKLQ